MSLSGAANRPVADPWFYVFGPRPEAARISLLCLPCAGGSPAMYAPWARELPADVSLVAVRLPGRESRLAEPAHQAMDDFVADFLPTLRRLAARPYAIFGHSMGALMAYALMRALPEEVAAPEALFLSGHRPPQLDLGRAPIYDKPKRDFLEAVRAMGGLPDEIWAHQELMDLIEPAMRADFTLCETYPRGPERHGDVRLEVPVHVFGGQEDETATPASLEHWAELCPDLRSLRIRSGGHFYLRPHQSALLADIAAALEPRPGARSARA
jgi:surfactin synthase thioesterase subunit